MNVDGDGRWSSLPPELLQVIGDTLDCPIDVLRFRSVCTSWRSSVPLPLFGRDIHRLHLKVPLPFPSDVVLLHSTVCRLNLLQPPNFPKGWLTKVTTSTNGRLRLLHPLSNYQVRYSPIRLSLTDLRFDNLTKASVLVDSSTGSPVVGINKVVCFPAISDNKNNEPSILAIIHEGKLCYWKYGDEKWTLLDDQNFQYDDIIEHKGQFYVVDRWGTVSWIDSSLKVIQYSPPLYGCGGQKNLVESCGDLYVVDTYLDGERNTQATWPEDENLIMDHADAQTHRQNERRRLRVLTSRSNPKAVDFRVYRLDEEWGRWVDVKSLDDRAFVLASDGCFSVSGQDFVGGKGNCIYFTDDDSFLGKRLSSDSIRVYQLESCSIEKLAEVPEHSKIFWPPNFSANHYPPGPGCSNAFS